MCRIQSVRFLWEIKMIRKSKWNSTRVELSRIALIFNNIVSCFCNFWEMVIDSGHCQLLQGKTSIKLFKNWLGRQMRAYYCDISYLNWSQNNFTTVHCCELMINLKFILLFNFELVDNLFPRKMILRSKKRILIKFSTTSIFYS